MLIIILSIIIVLLAALFVLATKGRRYHPDLPKLRGWYYAHRGLHGNGLPENSMAAFRAALEHGYGIELDVHLMKDGNLAVIHDSPLLRTTGQAGEIEDLTTEDLPRYNLENTDETIPTFRQVLDLFDGKAPMIVEIKTHNNNFAAVAEAVCNMLQDYQGAYCLESFDPRCIIWLRQNRPDLIRGQLSYNYFSSKNPLPFSMKFLLTNHLLNCLSKPDFVAYNFRHRHVIGNFLARKIWGVQGVSWTIRTPEDCAKAKAEGWLPIFEGFIPES